jgi:EamA-like transporter family
MIGPSWMPTRHPHLDRRPGRGTAHRPGTLVGRLLAGAGPQRHRLVGAFDLVPAMAGRRPWRAARLHDADLGHHAGLAGPGRATGRRTLRSADPGRRGRDLLLGDGHAARPATLPSVAGALGAAVLFAFGTVALRWTVGLPPLAATAWQVGLGCVPMVALGVLLEALDLAALSPAGWAAMAYMSAVPMIACYVCWIAALRRLPPGRGVDRDPADAVWAASRRRSPWASRSGCGRSWRWP